MKIHIFPSVMLQKEAILLSVLNQSACRLRYSQPVLLFVFFTCWRDRRSRTGLVAPGRDLMVFKAEVYTKFALIGAPLAISSLGYFAFGFIDDKVAVRLDILSPDGDTQQLYQPRRYAHMISSGETSLTLW